ncbi:MAG: universal stress protein [Deltaproteobacteria bacterium]|nr:universal stress protein [Deltaproteobacteria bacterium]
MSMKRILVPVDFSATSAAAVEYAIEFAKAFDAEIDLLHSYQINPGAITPYGPVLPDALFDSLRAAASEQLEKVHGQVRAAGVEAKTHLSNNVPSYAIVDAAQELSSDLIIMGTRGLTGIKHVFLGSVAERTLRHAPCPVLTVNHPDE